MWNQIFRTNDCICWFKRNIIIKKNLLLVRRSSDLKIQQPLVRYVKEQLINNHRLSSLGTLYFISLFMCTCVSYLICFVLCSCAFLNVLSSVCVVSLLWVCVVMYSFLLFGTFFFLKFVPCSLSLRSILLILLLCVFKPLTPPVFFKIILFYRSLSLPIVFKSNFNQKPSRKNQIYILLFIKSSSS